MDLLPKIKNKWLKINDEKYLKYFPTSEFFVEVIHYNELNKWGWEARDRTTGEFEESDWGNNFSTDKEAMEDADYHYLD